MGKIGWGELLVILVIAFLVIGPDKLPEFARSLGKAIGSLKKSVQDAARDLDIEEDMKGVSEDMESIQEDIRSLGKGLEKELTDMENH